jgi:hypothetical protein
MGTRATSCAYTSIGAITFASTGMPDVVRGAMNRVSMYPFFANALNTPYICTLKNFQHCVFMCSGRRHTTHAVLSSSKLLITIINWLRLSDRTEVCTGDQVVTWSYAR